MDLFLIKKKLDKSSEDSAVTTLRELLEKELLPAAVKCGISINDFWNYSVDEIVLLIRTYNDEQKIRAKETIMNNYNISVMTASFVNKAFAGKRLPKISELYSDFKEEEDQAMIKSYINQFKQFAIMHNKGV